MNAMGSRIRGASALALCLLLAYGCGGNSGAPGPATGGFGPVSATLDSDMVVLAGLTNGGKLVVMVALDFSEVEKEGMVPDKRAACKVTGKNAGGVSTNEIWWGFAGDKEVSLTISAEFEGTELVVHVNGQRLAPLTTFAEFRVKSDGSLQKFREGKAVVGGTSHGFDELRKIYADSMSPRDE